MTYTTLTELFKAICDAIRAKDETTEVIQHQDIPERIKAIPKGEDRYMELKPVDIGFLVNPFEMVNQEDIIIVEEEV